MSTNKATVKKQCMDDVLPWILVHVSIDGHIFFDGMKTLYNRAAETIRFTSF